ncbi:somatomedin-B and thrombospondin type-1 domain-containing protein-like [Grus japonensis]|uniref:Somatomedin-B and thrombospondin type-1 domain-containing protein-like n=1 Tax=Grus japonensis TaxID=30415 RepID=A0ABC9XIN4_GRUJA
MWGPLLCGGWLLATGYLAGAAGGCWHRCCPGRNNACWAPGARRARCYCDSYCERTGDCCEDYRAACRRAGEHPTCGTAKEVAKILPDSFGRDFRDPWRRAGLLLSEEPSSSPLPSYCGYFRLTQVGPPCRGQAWSRQLHRDKRVCVECQGDASHRHPRCTGHGLQGVRTFWVAASVAGCQGSWVREGLQEGCACSPPALIFV